METSGRRRSSLNSVAVRRKSSTAGKKGVILRVQSPDKNDFKRFESISDGEVEAEPTGDENKLGSNAETRRSKSLNNSRNTSPLAFNMVCFIAKRRGFIRIRDLEV